VVVDPITSIEYREFSQETLAELKKILDAKSSPIVDPTDYGESLDITSWIPVFLKYVATLLIGAGIGVYAAGGIPIGPGPNRDDVLQQCYEADRISQAAILREYAAKGFANDTAGRLAATEWFNNNRFRNRATDFRPYTTAVVDNFAAGTLTKFADELEGK
jgi:hypothetical protein